MGTHSLNGPQSFKAAATISAYRVVYLSAAETVSHWATSTSLCIGVSLEGGDTGAYIPVETRYGTIVKIQAGANIAAGAVVGPATDGAGVITTRALGTVTAHVPTIGVAVSAGSTGTYIPCILQPLGFRA